MVIDKQLTILKHYIDEKNKFLPFKITFL